MREMRFVCTSFTEPRSIQVSIVISFADRKERISHRNCIVCKTTEGLDEVQQADATGKKEPHAELCVRLVRELQGTVYFCGAKKRAMQTFCYKHYRDLPRAKQYALYNRTGEGYEEAYQDARQYLGQPVEGAGEGEWDERP